MTNGGYDYETENEKNTANYAGTEHALYCGLQQEDHK